MAQQEFHAKTKKWFRISLRAFLVLFLVSGVAIGLFSNKIREARRVRRIVDTHNSQGRFHAVIFYDYQCDLEPKESPKPPGPKWLRKYAGDNLFANVQVIVIKNNEALEIFDELKPTDLTNLKFVSFYYCRLENLHFLEQAPSIESVIVSSDLVSLDGIEKLPRLKSLRIEQCSLNEIEPIRNCKELELFEISNCTGVNDFSPLFKLPSLTSVLIANSALTDKQVDEIKEKLPPNVSFEFRQVR